MKFPEVLYNQFKTKRTGVLPGFEAVVETVMLSSTTVTVDLYIVPKEYIFMLNTLVISAWSGTGQTVERSEIRMRPPKGLIIMLKAEIYQNVNKEEMLNFNGDVWLQSGTQIWVDSIFSADGNANMVHGFMQGLLIPELSV